MEFKIGSPLEEQLGSLVSAGEDDCVNVRMRHQVFADSVSDCPDYEDNRILECAAASGSTLIVSDDNGLTTMTPWRGIPIITSADFVKRTDVMRRARRR